MLWGGVIRFHGTTVVVAVVALALAAPVMARTPPDFSHGKRSEETVQPDWVPDIDLRGNRRRIQVEDRLIPTESSNAFLPRVLKKKAKMANGCWKGDQYKSILVGGLVPTDVALEITEQQKSVKGHIGYFDIDGTFHMAMDECLSASDLREYVCVTFPTTGKKTMQQFTFNCTGSSTCLDGRCLTTGCAGEQSPSLDTNQDGVADACLCPQDTLPIDTDKDGNTDACTGNEILLEKVGSCLETFKPENYPGGQIETIYDNETGEPQKLLKYCGQSNSCKNAVLTHTMCNAKGILSTSNVPCDYGHICKKGACVPGFCNDKGECFEGPGETCEPGDIDGVGYVIVTKSGGSQEWYGDACKAVNPQKGISDTLLKTYCPFTCIEKTISNNASYYSEEACPPTHHCDKEAHKCVPLDPAMVDPGSDDGSSDGGASGGSDDGEDPCVPETSPICEDDDDPTGKYKQFGTLQFGGEVSGCGDPILLPMYPKADNCIWDQGIPTLLQYGCKGNELGSYLSHCKGVLGDFWDCDIQAAEPAQRGICQYYGDTPPVCEQYDGLDPKDLTTAGGVKGHDGFSTGPDDTTHAFNKPDECAGPGSVLKWYCTAPEELALGHKYKVVPCPYNQFCELGACQEIELPDTNFCDDNPKDPTCDDTDKDTIVNAIDNCPDTPNTDQADADGDGIGDACEEPGKIDEPDDSDGDGIFDPADNCVNTPNPDQLDSDGDGIGDVCDEDINCDLYPDHPWCQEFTHDCDDNDHPSNVHFRGDVYIDQGTDIEKHQSDYCVDNYTAVMEISCGAGGGKFYYEKHGCPGGKKCQLGKCL